MEEKRQEVFVLANERALEYLQQQPYNNTDHGNSFGQDINFILYLQEDDESNNGDDDDV
jgi:hypothetical protein